ncbi:hypothetical protein OTB20_08600 [Streptomyces sp. H27-H1]|uniref:hypothetical protein n=1 Tax=Streptomyces sp. H27-H1 TaxID=2996461 RepID=UPI002271853A|nr:hypothetical protein [Streptomyces sp. H27-H1]MCY0926265.1 hypothetical protein [Streptomyces sp. H27-H1]
MIVMTGPQVTVQECEELAELAGFHGALLVSAHHIPWADVHALYRLAGWAVCPLASADVTMAGALGIPMYDLTS